MPAEEATVDAIFCAAIELATLDERAACVKRECGEDVELRRRVEALIAAHFRAGNFLESPATGLDATSAQPSFEILGTAIGPYKLLEQIGEGGMGTVYMAEQTAPVQRKVAIKIIKPGMDSRQIIARFEAERQALALMDHPNIARVFDAGATETGRPYFVMELVRGVPMTEFCNEKNLSIRERLELFVTACKAIQHAHQKGIIHRDIKPTNVLVTMHDGRPMIKVIDFGVAKATGQKLTDKTLFTGFTQMIGTPLYMSPEQAEMTSQDIDTRSDIFSLGVLLYELLTGTTPFDSQRLRSASFDELRRIIREEEPPRPSARLTTLALEAASTVGTQRKSDPRQLSRLFRGELDWIVMKCLEKDRTRRYETACALAGDVERYLHDEAVQACPPSTRYRFGKFVRRNKRTLMTTSLLGLMLLVVIGVLAGSFGWVMRDKAARIAKASDDIEDALRDAEKLQGQQKWAEALAVVKQAQTLLINGGDEILSQRLRQRTADLEFLVKLEDAGLAAAEVKDGHFDVDKGGAAYARAFHEYGIDLETFVPTEAGAVLRSRVIGVEVAAAVDNWVSTHRPNTRDWRYLLALARAADPDDFRDQIREAIANSDRKRLVQLAAEDKIIDLSGPTLVLLARCLDVQGESTKGVTLLRKAQGRHPGDFWLNCHLALWLYEMKPAQTDETVRYWSAAVALRPKSPGVFVNLGLALGEQHSYDEEIAAYQQAIRLKPNYAEAHSNLGEALRLKGQLDEATAEFREAIRLKSGFAAAHLGLGSAHVDKNQLDEAVAEFREAIRLKKNFAEARSNLGNVFRIKGQLDKALVEQREAVRLDPNLAEAHANLATTLRDEDQLDESIAEYRKAIRLKPGFVAAHTNLGNALASKGQLNEADAEYREAVRLKPDDAGAHCNFGGLLRDIGRIDEAIIECRQAIRLKPEMAEAHANLGNALGDNGQLDEAVAECREAVRIKPNDAAIHSNLGAALDSKGQNDEALLEYRKAIQLNKDYAEAHASLGDLLRRMGRLDEAIAECREAVRGKQGLPAAHNNLGAALGAKGQLNDAITEFREAIRLKTDLAAPHCNLGAFLFDEGRIDEAIVEYREAIRLKKDFADAHCNLGSALVAKDRLDEGIAEFREAIRLKKDDVNAHANLGDVLISKGQTAEGIAECRQAVFLDNDSDLAHLNLGNAYANDKPDEALAEFRESVRLNKDNATAHHNLGKMLYDKGRPGEAIAELREVIRLEPRSAEARDHLGKALRANGQSDEAIAEFRQAIRINNDFVDAHEDLAKVLDQKRQLDDVIAEMREVVRLKNDSADAHNQLGEVLAFRGRFDEAIAEFRQAIRLKKDDADAHHNLASAFALKGQVDEAIAEYREAIHLKKDDSEAYKNLCLIYTAKGQTEEGIAAGNEAARLAPNDAQALNSLAWLLVACHEAKFRDPGRAVELAKHAVSIAPKDGPIWNTLGLAHLRAGNWKESAVAFEKSMEFRKGGDANDWFLLAMAHWRMNHQDEARQWYDKAVAWMEMNQPQNADLLRFRAEAEELMKVKK